MRRTVFLALIAVAVPASPWAQEGPRAGLDPGQPTVLITGSNRGIGLGFATRYADEGWNVIATARKPDEALDLQTLAGEFDTVHVEELDVTDESQLSTLARKYADVPIDLLINNAAFHGGAPEHHLLGGYDYSTFEHYMAVNVFGPLKVSEAFIDSIAASERKKIVTLTTGLASLTNQPPFSCFQFQAISKAAMNRAMRGLQVQLAPRGVTVALISPGTVDTDGYAAAGAACAPVLGDAASGPPPRAAFSVGESVAAMVQVIGSLDESYDGNHLDLKGDVVPW